MVWFLVWLEGIVDVLYIICELVAPLVQKVSHSHNEISNSICGAIELGFQLQFEH